MCLSLAPLWSGLPAERSSRPLTHLIQLHCHCSLFVVLVCNEQSPSTPLSPLSLPLLSSRLRSSAEELLRISHELKLLLLLSIPDGSGEERVALQAEIEELRKEVASLMGDAEVVKGDDGLISSSAGPVAVS